MRYNSHQVRLQIVSSIDKKKRWGRWQTWYRDTSLVPLRREPGICLSLQSLAASSVREKMEEDRGKCCDHCEGIRRWLRRWSNKIAVSAERTVIMIIQTPTGTLYPAITASAGPTVRGKGVTTPCDILRGSLMTAVWKLKWTSHNACRERITMPTKYDNFSNAVYLVRVSESGQTSCNSSKSLECISGLLRM